MFFGKTLDSESASLRPGAQMGTAEYNAGGNSAMASIEKRNVIGHSPLGLFRTNVNKQ